MPGNSVDGAKGLECNNPYQNNKAQSGANAKRGNALADSGAAMTKSTTAQKLDKFIAN